MLGFRTRFWVNTVGRIAPLVVSFAVTFSSATEFVKLAVFFGASVFLILVEYLGVYRPLTKLEDVVKNQLDFYFTPFVEGATYNGVNATIRVNVMLCRWRPLGRRFFQYYQNGMQGHPDAGLSIGVSQGVCGHAFTRKSHALCFRDLRNQEPEALTKRWKFTDKQQGTVKHVLAVASVPLSRASRAWSGHIKTHFYGVLNVDALDDAGVQLLADPAIQRQIEGFAKFVRITLA